MLDGGETIITSTYSSTQQQLFILKQSFSLFLSKITTFFSSPADTQQLQLLQHKLLEENDLKKIFNLVSQLQLRNQKVDIHNHSRSHSVKSLNVSAVLKNNKKEEFSPPLFLSSRKNQQIKVVQIDMKAKPQNINLKQPHTVDQKFEGTWLAPKQIRQQQQQQQQQIYFQTQSYHLISNGSELLNKNGQIKQATRTSPNESICQISLSNGANDISYDKNNEKNIFKQNQDKVLLSKKQCIQIPLKTEQVVLKRLTPQELLKMKSISETDDNELLDPFSKDQSQQQHNSESINRLLELIKHEQIEFRNNTGQMLLIHCISTLADSNNCRGTVGIEFIKMQQEALQLSPPKKRKADDKIGFPKTFFPK